MFIIIITKPVVGLLRLLIMVTTSFSILLFAFTKFRGGRAHTIKAKKKKKKILGSYLTIMLTILILGSEYF